MSALHVRTTMLSWFGASYWKPLVPGLAVSALLALVASWLTNGLNDPLARNPLLVAILFGLLIGNVMHLPDNLRPGLEFAMRKLLRLGIVLVGFRVTVHLLLDLGWAPWLVAAAELLSVFFISLWLLRRVFRFDLDFSVMLAAGSSICGAAAILSTAATIQGRPQQTALAVTIITLFGTLALFAYPYLFLEGFIPGLDDETYGVFVGASIYELAQVYGAGFSVSELAVNTATLVKLAKVLMLIPMILAMRYFWKIRSRTSQSGPVAFPWFIAWFLAVMLFNSAVALPGLAKGMILQFDTFLFIVVMVALGLNTRISKLFAGKGVMHILLASVLILGLSAAASYGYTRLALPSPAAAPAHAGAAAERVIDGRDAISRGAQVFNAIGCAKCHVPSMPAADQEIHLYSDLLLHDMGPALDDKIVQGDANGFDWRTTPLLGLGLRSRYLHDGRATTLRDTIAAHDGEGRIVRDRFLDLNERDKAAVYAFLNSL